MIERLNEVFGLNGWDYTSKIIENSGAMVVLKVRLTVPAYGIVREQFGGNDNNDRGDAYKGALTDALGKIAGYLGIGMYVYKGGGPKKTNPGRGRTQQTPAPVPAPVRAPRPIRTEAAQAVADRKIEGMQNGKPYDQVSAEEKIRAQFFGGSTKDRLKMFADLSALMPPELYTSILRSHGVDAPSQFRSANVAWDSYLKLLNALADYEQRQSDPQTFEHFEATEGGVA